jgi:3-dehydroshikimate dehydratase
MRSGRALVVAAMLAVSTTRGVRGGQDPPATSRAPVLRVTKTTDDGSEGTLRWAITISNSTAARERIEIDPGARAIVVTAPLPAIKGPVEMIGIAWQRTGDYVVIDASGYIPAGGPERCAGAVPGQFGANVRTMTLPGLQIVDTSDVDLSGVELHGFCIGVLINRATGVLIHDNRITDSRGGAGVMLTGDDGQGNPTPTTTIHNKVQRNEFVDNGDGLELTRGASFNLVADNVFRSTSANPEPSQGIEILRGNDNVVSGNRFEGYSDGLQINWGDRNYIAGNTFTANTFGVNLTGIGNVVDGNTITGNRIGIVVRPADPSPVVRLTRNRISRNSQPISRCEAGGTCDPATPKGAIVFGLPGLEHASFVGSRGRGVATSAATLQHICPDRARQCQPAPNRGLHPPTLSAARTTGTRMTVTGTLVDAPAGRYVVELFANADEGGEAEFFLGDGVVTAGRGTDPFTISVTTTRARQTFHSITATVTSHDGATSPLSAPVLIQQSSSR